MKNILTSELSKSVTIDDLQGIKVTLINMPIREGAKPNNPPLGPLSLAARLISSGVIVNIVDLNAYRIIDEDSKKSGLSNGRFLTFGEAENLLYQVFNHYGEQDLVGLSGLITTLRWQENIAKIVRKLLPNTIITSGGGLATEFKTILFKWIPELDGIADSEGDDIVIKMAYDAKLIHDKGLKNAIHSGMLKPYFIDIYNERPRFFYQGEPIKNLDSLPLPAWDLIIEDINGFRILDMYLSNPVWGGDAKNSSATPFTMNKSISIISSRGCPFSCKFCFRGAQGERNYRVRSARTLSSEMLFYIEKYGVDFIGIPDDNFMVSSKRIVELASFLKPLVKDKAIRWGVHGRMDEASDLRPSGNKDKRIEYMADAGCVYIGFGAESASPNVLNNMGKGGFILKNGTVKVNGHYFPRTMVEAIKSTKEVGIHTNCTWIMGYPEETLDDLKTSVAFIKWQEDFYTEGKEINSLEYEIAKNSVNKNMFIATAYPGTEMFKDAYVREKLNKHFGINFDKNTQDPIADDNLHNYVLELNDATKLLYDKDGAILNYSKIPDDLFFQAKKYIEDGEIYNILDI
jgi:radical SAM superfamily enzyme YgiQ (UPF0313 family)